MTKKQTIRTSDVRIAKYTFEWWRIVQGTLFYSFISFALGMGLSSEDWESALWICGEIALIYIVICAYYYRKDRKFSQALVVAFLKMLTFPTGGLG